MDNCLKSGSLYFLPIKLQLRSMKLAVDSSVETKVSHLAFQVASEARRRFGEKNHIYWFGSWVNGDATEVSDLDIGIDVSSSVSSLEFLNFIDWVEELPTLFQFDIINMSEISETFRNKIIKNGRLI